MTPRVWSKRAPKYPADAIYVGRGTPWGNPFKIGRDGDRATVIAKFRAKVEAMPEQQRRHWLKDLRGRPLLCWCAPQPCHADVLLEYANRGGD